MMRPNLAELELRCQKPQHRVVGNWLARRVARPLALRVTWLILPLGISAHAMTLMALLLGFGAAIAFAGGGIAGWLLGAAMAHAWYLLDHVDGQLARYHGTASLDGTALDYLMHHLVNICLPVGIGVGLAVTRLEPMWILAGQSWGLGLLTIGLVNDTRYKSFFQRLKRLDGQLVVHGGGGGRPAAPPGPGLSWRRRAGWLARKLCEVHVTLGILPLIAGWQWWFHDAQLLTASGYALLMAVLAPTVASWEIVRGLRQHAAEEQFAQWFRREEPSRSLRGPHPIKSREFTYPGTHPGGNKYS